MKVYLEKSNIYLLKSQNRFYPNDLSIFSWYGPLNTYNAVLIGPLDNFQQASEKNIDFFESFWPTCSAENVEGRYDNLKRSCLTPYKTYKSQQTYKNDFFLKFFLHCFPEHTCLGCGGDNANQMFVLNIRNFCTEKP